MTANTNLFIGIAAAGMASIAKRGMSVASAVAVAIVWNDDIGPTLGQPREPRNVILGRLQRRLTDKGMKVSSVDTWRKHGQKFAHNYQAEIERIILDTINAEGRNSEPTAAELVANVTTWANAKFPTLQQFNDELNGKETQTEEEKALTLARKLIAAVNRTKNVSLLANVARIAEAKAQVLGSHGNLSADAIAELHAIIASVVNVYKAEAEAEAEAEIADAEDTATNVVTLAA